MTREEQFEKELVELLDKMEKKVNLIEYEHESALDKVPDSTQGHFRTMDILTNTLMKYTKIHKLHIAELKSLKNKYIDICEVNDDNSRTS